MKDTQHTPGSWFQCETTDISKIDIANCEPGFDESCDKFRIPLGGAWIAHCTPTCSLETTQANARLIAAAPDMLEALLFVLRVVTEGPIETEENLSYMQDRMGQVIALATGDTDA